MTIEIALTGANLIAVLGYAIRTEGRLSRLEALIEELRRGR